jgi:hypothetical protein
MTIPAAPGHVETTVTGNPDGDLCGIAVRVAEMVEPGLP